MAKNHDSGVSPAPHVIIKGRRYNFDSEAYLDASNLGLHDLAEIEGLEQVAGILREVNLSGNHLQSIDGLAGCIKMERLDISNNQISDVGAIVNMPRLLYCWAFNNHITQLPPLNKFIRLNRDGYGGSFLFDQNEISEVTVEKDIGIRNLGLCSNRITDASWIWKVWIDESEGNDPQQYGLGLDENPLTPVSRAEFDRFTEDAIDHERNVSCCKGTLEYIQYSR